MPYSKPLVPFWGSRGGGGGVSAQRSGSLLHGVPLDVTASCRAGTAEGPAAVREASHHIETYSPTLNGDLLDAGLVDLGDLELEEADLEVALDSIEWATAQILEHGRPIMVGGEHTATLAAFRAVKRKHRHAVLISLDAHLDLADELEGRRLSHGTWAARLDDEWGLECLAFLGVRSGTREEWRRARAAACCSSELRVPAPLLERLAETPVYLSVDIDLLDPAAAPGTGCPEPGGPSSRDLFRFLYSLKGLNVVGLDVMEVLPRVDSAGVTAAVAAKLIREAAILFSSPR